MVFLKFYFEKVDFEKNQQMTKNMKNYSACKELMFYFSLKEHCEHSYKNTSHVDGSFMSLTTLWPGHEILYLLHMDHDARKHVLGVHKVRFKPACSASVSK